MASSLEMGLAITGQANSKDAITMRIRFIGVNK